MAKKCALSALIRLPPRILRVRGSFFDQLFVLVIDGGPEDGAATAADRPGIIVPRVRFFDT